MKNLSLIFFLGLFLIGCDSATVETTDEVVGETIVVVDAVEEAMVADDVIESTEEEVEATEEVIEE